MSWDFATLVNWGTPPPPVNCFAYVIFCKPQGARGLSPRLKEIPGGHFAK